MLNSQSYQNLCIRLHLCIYIIITRIHLLHFPLSVTHKFLIHIYWSFNSLVITIFSHCHSQHKTCTKWLPFSLPLLNLSVSHKLSLCFSRLKLHNAICCYFLSISNTNLSWNSCCETLLHFTTN